MREHLRSLPNQLTAIRIALLPLLWTFALFRLSALLGIGVAICFVTDLLDGYFARKLGQVTAFGSKFDSLADNLLIPSGLVWLWLLRPDVYRDYPWVWMVAIALYCASLLVGVIKFRRFANLHLQSKRVGAVGMYLFVSHAFIAEQYSPVLFTLAMAMFIISSAEGLLLQLICPQVDEHMHSVLIVLRRSRVGAGEKRATR
jgi:cardiolipin synthase (CMP-forming)